MPATLPSPLDVPVEINGDEVAITQGDRRYRVLGLEKNTSLGILRLNVLVTRGESLHVDTFDLYSSRHRVMYAKQAGEELGVKEEVVSRDLGRVLWKIEELQGRQIKNALEPKEAEVTLSEERKQRRWTCCAIRIYLAASWLTSSGTAWWARKPTNW